MSYVIASMEDVMEGKIAKYNSSLKAVREAARNRAGEHLEALSFGGITPLGNQYAEVPPRPEMFDGIGGSTLSDTFRQNLDSTGWNSILAADLSDDGQVKKDWVLGVAGICFLDSAKRETQFYMTKGDFTHPILDIEEMHKEEGGVALIFDITESNVDQFVFDKYNSFTLYADIIATGYQRIKPLGVSEIIKEKAIAETY